MTNPTSNFGWQMPTSTDLVTDLPADFEVFGQAVDTSLADLKGGTTGQVLKKNSNTDMDFVWSADAAGMTNPMTTTGDTIYSSSGSTPARLGIGSTGNVLTVAGGVPTWAAPIGIPPTNASNYVSTFGSTTSTSYTDLASAGPAVTVTTGTRALVIIGAGARNTSAATSCSMSFAVSGATTIAANDDNAYKTSEVDYDKSSYATIVTGLTAGSNTFTAKYKVPAGTGQFSERNIIVIDMGS